MVEFTQQIEENIAVGFSPFPKTQSKPGQREFSYQACPN